jgi:hypothetical protein
MYIDDKDKLLSRRKDSFLYQKNDNEMYLQMYFTFYNMTSWVEVLDIFSVGNVLTLCDTVPFQQKWRSRHIHIALYSGGTKFLCRILRCLFMVVSGKLTMHIVSQKKLNRVQPVHNSDCYDFCYQVPTKPNKHDEHAWCAVGKMSSYKHMTFGKVLKFSKNSFSIRGRNALFVVMHNE